ncbi:Ferro-O2-oxidoreductase [Komagataella phaffii CBS 7435]|uniref:Ferro-O2-oxidoreductase n=3 Tax=Komagataella TaxID=460517 RepID=C4R1S1_KOMPG|nr:Ferro-O2-oxidoreductase [Komagataella phaffii GS115]AOA62477.1 GQ67_00861T0 [Komagataella phaffii]CAC33177.2 Fet3 protein [Komagataella pastoris]CAH2448016.1 Ferro-O2-oxidoreductase [Komagataella phaffii CBS 7435]AOA68020.1 GQ68_00528T0 [Komagataella phaffii GS115]CAY69445.1 Ferro-O2-oxidoreductase [Komagataella phaffii GS115]
MFVFEPVLLAVLVASTCVTAKTHTWNFTTGFVNANPDGVYERDDVIGLNGQWPLPVLEADKGDRIELYLTNGFEDYNTSLHFHGLFQNGTNSMDGPELITQCPIPPGETMLYNFTVDQVGAYWYHSHTAGQYGDGMRAAFIVHDGSDDDDFPYEYDEEFTFTISEWYHESSVDLIPNFMSRFNPTGAEPIPQNFLFNDTRNFTWNVEPSKTYKVNLINVGGFVSQYLWMEDHTFKVVQVDGVYTQPNETDMIYITVAQRYTVLIETKDDTSRNYALMQRVDDTMLDVIPKDLELNGTNYIVYNESAGLPEEYKVESLDIFLDDFWLEPLEAQEAYPDPDYQIVVDVAMDNLDDGVNYAFFNNLTYVAPKVPVLGTVFSAGEDAINPLVYGSNTNSFVLEKDEVIEIVLNNLDTGKHPFHLHGHVFQTVVRGPDYGEESTPVPYNASEAHDIPENPMRRDTVYVNPQSYFVIRFKADNPGVWFFHCHIEWHLDQGLALVLIEDPLSIQSQQNLDDNWKRMCEVNNMPYVGNAAANTENFLDLTDENVQVKNLPAGFTARGIVALVFSCIAGILGCVAIGLYGLAATDDNPVKLSQDLGIDEEFIQDETSSQLSHNGSKDTTEKTATELLN